MAGAHGGAHASSLASDAVVLKGEQRREHCRFLFELNQTHKNLQEKHRSTQQISFSRKNKRDICLHL